MNQFNDTKLSNMFKKWGLLIFLLVILLVVISLRAAGPPSVKQGNIADTSFSVSRALIHLHQIANAPHSTGSLENARVRAYIVSVCKQEGFEVETQYATSISPGRNKIIAANIYNIIARKKGTNNSKSVVLMAHYDSEFSTPGASDDGAGVAAMLETGSALKALGPLKNDLILLFTDGEEIGLMGARAFVKDSSLIKGIGLVINFEARGNSGPSNMFEVNDHNGWVINEYAKSVAHPFANSLGYEVYKKLPNSTDFTLFKNAGITGLNNANIEGFVNYHSPNDKVQNLDLKTLQHHGDNMLSLAKHFGNLNITTTKANDISYFNFIGTWFIHYPASWNIVFVMIVNLLLIFYIFLGFKHQRIKITGFVVSTLLFPVVLAIIYFTVKILQAKIVTHYPMYSHFNQNNSYNIRWYFLAMSALAMTIYTTVYWLLSKKMNLSTLLAGVFLIVAICMNLMQLKIPSASYLLFIPLGFMLLIHIFILAKNVHDKQLSLKGALLFLLSVVPAIFLVTTTIMGIFTAFALSTTMPFVVIAVGVLAGLLLPVMYDSFRQQEFFIPVMSLVVLIVALSGGQRSSGYSESKPLQASVYYMLDADAAKGNWVSDFTTTNKWSAQFFKDKATGKQVNPQQRKLINEAPVLDIAAPIAAIVSDSVVSNQRNVKVHFSTNHSDVNRMLISIADSSAAIPLMINGQSINAGDNPELRTIAYFGLTSTGFNVDFKIETGKHIRLNVTSILQGLPVFKSFDTNYPKGVVPTQGQNANTTQISKHFFF
ncbi:M20/M25/M40 family metallo-hydrolase [soil metagenome]